MPNLAEWNRTIKASLSDLIVRSARQVDIDPTYGVYAAALLWPVRAANRDESSREALQSILGDDTSIVLNAISMWGDDPVAAARQLTIQSRENAALKAALDKLLVFFRDVLLEQGLLNPKPSPLYSLSKLFAPLGRLFRRARSNPNTKAGLNIAGSVIGANVVIGGQQYIAGDLVIRLVIFSNWQQIALVLVVFGAVIAGVVFAIWRFNLPPVMDRNFNIAVAEFAIDSTVNPDARQRATEAAEHIRSTIYNALVTEYAYNPGVQVERHNMGVVSGATAAEQLAAYTQADMVIYGNVRYVGGKYEYNPIFYVSDRLKPDIGEIIGGHDWLRRQMTDQQLTSMVSGDEVERARLEQETQILVEFTQALTYLFSVNNNQIGNARRSIELTRRLVDNYTTQNGQSSETTVRREVVYLFASTIQRLSGNLDLAREYAETTLALTEIPYGRGYLALGNIFYEQGVAAFRRDDFPEAQSQLASARDQYQRAADLPEDSAYPAFVAEKASLGLGNIYMLLYQMPATDDQKLQYAQDALAAFQFVTDSYTRQSTTRAGEQLIGLAAQAWFLSGSVHERLGNSSAAIADYGRFLGLDARGQQRDDVRAQLDQLQTQVATTRAP